MTEAARSFTATVTDIRLESRIDGICRWQIALDHTFFSAVSPTGILIATSLSGARLEVPVLSIVEDRGTIWHVVDKPLSAETKVTGTITMQPG